MDLENTGKDWMDEAPLLAALDKKHPFTVPANYFNGAHEQIKSRCLIEDARFNNEEEFTVPEGYFELLSSQIESQIRVQSLRNLADYDGFKVPEGYFSTLGERILAKTETRKDPAKVLIKPIRSNWIRYAAAACVTVVLGSVLVFNNQRNSIESQLGRIPDQEIINYLQIHSDLGDTPLIMESLSQNANLRHFGLDISETDLEEYINTTL